MYFGAAQIIEMGSLGDVQSALAAHVEDMRMRTAAQEDNYCATIAELQEQVSCYSTSGSTLGHQLLPRMPMV